MTAYATLAVIRLLNNVQIQGTLTAVGTTPVALVGAFNFAGATVTGLVASGSTFVNSILMGATTIEGTSVTVTAPATFENTTTFSGPVIAEGGTFTIEAGTVLDVVGDADFTGAVLIDGPSFDVDAPADFTDLATFSGGAAVTGGLTSTDLTLTPVAADPGPPGTIWLDSADVTHPSFNGTQLALITDVITQQVVTLTTTAINPWTTTGQTFTVQARCVLLGNFTVVVTIGPLIMSPTLATEPVTFDNFPLAFAPSNAIAFGWTPVVVDANVTTIGIGTVQNNVLTISPATADFTTSPGNSGWGGDLSFSYNLGVL
jgi:hypothetical protein